MTRINNDHGTSLVEVIIVSVLTAAVLGIFYDGVIAVNTMTVNNSREMKSQSRQTDVLEMIRRELEQSGMDARFTVAVDGKSISYTKLIGAIQTGSDVSGIWSQTYTIDMTADGEVRRTQGGRTVSWGRGGKALTFSHNPAVVMSYRTETVSTELRH